MTDLAMRAMINWHLAKSRMGERVRDVVTNEDGEMGSWLIVAAGLAAAAAAVVGILEGWFEDKANDITSN